MSTSDLLNTVGIILFGAFALGTLPAIYVWEKLEGWREKLSPARFVLTARAWAARGLA